MTRTRPQPFPLVLAQCERMATLIAPELSAAPLYMVLAPASFPDTLALAFVRPGHTDFAIREMLINRGDWRGAGTTVTFCKSMALDAGLAVAVHELAHVLPFIPPTPDVDPTPAQRQAQQTSRATELAGVTRDVHPGWETGHDLAFIRHGLHLHFRAWRFGFNPCLHATNLANWQYGTSPGWKYMFALGDEPARMIDATFAEIEATDPPQPFTDLYQSDVAYWQERHPEYRGIL